MLRNYLSKKNKKRGFGWLILAGFGIAVGIASVVVASVFTLGIAGILTLAAIGVVTTSIGLGAYMNEQKKAKLNEKIEKVGDEMQEMSKPKEIEPMQTENKIGKNNITHSSQNEASKCITNFDKKINAEKKKAKKPSAFKQVPYVKEQKIMILSNKEAANKIKAIKEWVEAYFAITHTLKKSGVLIAIKTILAKDKGDNPQESLQKINEALFSAKQKMSLLRARVAEEIMSKIEGIIKGEDLPNETKKEKQSDRIEKLKEIKILDDKLKEALALIPYETMQNDNDLLQIKKIIEKRNIRLYNHCRFDSAFIKMEEVTNFIKSTHENMKSDKKNEKMPVKQKEANSFMIEENINMTDENIKTKRINNAFKPKSSLAIELIGYLNGLITNTETNLFKEKIIKKIQST